MYLVRPVGETTVLKNENEWRTSYIKLVQLNAKVMNMLYSPEGYY